MKQLFLLILITNLSYALSTDENEESDDVGLNPNVPQNEFMAQMIGRLIEEPTLGAILYEENEDNHFLDLPIGDFFSKGLGMAGESNEGDENFELPEPLTTKKPETIEGDYDCPDEDQEVGGKSVYSDYEYKDGDEVQDVDVDGNPIKPSLSGNRAIYTKRRQDPTDHHRRHQRANKRKGGRRPSIDESEDYDSLHEIDHNPLSNRQVYDPQDYDNDFYDIPDVRTRRKSRKRQRKDRKRKKSRKHRVQEDYNDYDIQDYQDYGMRTDQIGGSYDFDAYDQLEYTGNDHTSFEGFNPRRRHNKSKRRRGRKFYGRRLSNPTYNHIYDDDSDESFEDLRDLNWPMLQGGRRNYDRYGRDRSNTFLHQQHTSNLPDGRRLHNSRNVWPPGSGDRNSRAREFAETAPSVSSTTTGTTSEITPTTVAPLTKNSEDFVGKSNKEKENSKSNNRMYDLLPGFTPPAGITYDIHEIPDQPEQNVPDYDLEHPVDIDTTGSGILALTPRKALNTLDHPKIPIDNNPFDVRVGGDKNLGDQTLSGRHRSNFGNRFGFVETDRYDRRSSGRKSPNYNFDYPVHEDTIQGMELLGNTDYGNMFDQQGRSIALPTFPDYDYDSQFGGLGQVPPPPNPYDRRLPKFHGGAHPQYPISQQRIPPHSFTDQPYDPLDLIRYTPRRRVYSRVPFPSAQTPWDPNRSYRAGYLGHRPNRRPNFMGRSNHQNLDPMFPDNTGYRFRLPNEESDYSYNDGSDTAMNLPSIPDGYDTDY